MAVLFFWACEIIIQVARETEGFAMYDALMQLRCEVWHM